MKFRKLRIAWSVFWGLACVLLVLLWVRGVWFHDFIRGPFGSERTFAVDSYGGKFYLSSRLNVSRGMEISTKDPKLSGPITVAFPTGWRVLFMRRSPTEDAPGVGYLILGGTIKFEVPYW